MVRNLFFLLIILFVSACGFLDGNTTDDKIALARKVLGHIDDLKIPEHIDLDFLPKDINLLPA